MRQLIFALLALPLVLGLCATNAESADNRIATITNITMHLQHYPSDQEIGVLRQIANDPKATEGERILAGALMRMRHQVTADDAARLHDLKTNDEAAADERRLAGILLGIMHHPSVEDQKQLKAILKRNR